MDVKNVLPHRSKAPQLIYSAISTVITRKVPQETLFLPNDNVSSTPGQKRAPTE